MYYGVKPDQNQQGAQGKLIKMLAMLIQISAGQPLVVTIPSKMSIPKAMKLPPTRKMMNML